MGYQIRTDLADEIKPRLYTHSLELSYGLEHRLSRFALAAGVGLVYESAGERRSEILVDSERTELFVSDVSLLGRKSWTPMENMRISCALGNEFPTSPEARREEYNSVTTLDLSLSTPLFSKSFTVRLGGELHYIWNSFRYSPATGELNKQGGGRASFAARWRVWQGLHLEGSAGSQLSRYLDGTNDMGYRTAAGASYDWSSLSMGVALSNGTYLDQDDATIWFIDEYRRMVSLKAQLTF